MSATDLIAYMLSFAVGLLAICLVLGPIITATVSACANAIETARAYPREPTPRKARK